MRAYPVAAIKTGSLVLPKEKFLYVPTQEQNYLLEFCILNVCNLFFKCKKIWRPL